MARNEHETIRPAAGTRQRDRVGDRARIAELEAEVAALRTALTRAGVKAEHVTDLTVGELTGEPVDLDTDAWLPDVAAAQAEARHGRETAMDGTDPATSEPDHESLRTIRAALAESRAALRERDERLRLILNSAADYAIFTTDLDRHIVSWNVGAERVLGWAEEEIVGRSADIIFTPEDRAAGVPEREVAKAQTEGRAENERWHLRRDGSRFWASGLSMPLRDPEAGPEAPPLGLLAVMRDQTERRVAEERRTLLVNELNHRVKNTLVVVQSLALLGTRGAPDLAAFAASFQRRILALARAHDLLTHEHWTGGKRKPVVALR
jgi:PAS domain S-box-containing protein